MRRERIASLLEREISSIVTQEIRDPRLGFITITKVIVSHDLKNATVYFSSLDDKIASLKILKGAKGYIKSVLAHRIRLKFLPQLHFKIDNSYEYGRKIDELIEKISDGDKE
jgi:ribosome-binding factor A